MTSRRPRRPDGDPAPAGPIEGVVQGQPPARSARGEAIEAVETLLEDVVEVDAPDPESDDCSAPPSGDAPGPTSGGG